VGDVVDELDVSDILAKFPGAIELNRGGQKVVYEFDHPTYGPTVVKVGRFASPASLERIRREFDTLASLDSEYFPKCYEFDELSDQRFLILEERLDGRDLSEHIRDYGALGDATELTYEVALGLTNLWERRIVHRDIKPQNIIVTASGPRIIDLGIARLLDCTSLTATNRPYGPCTPAYASPEQLENRKDSIDHRSDQFSLGIVYGQLLLMGTHPFNPAIAGGPDTVGNILEARWGRDALSEQGHDVAIPVLDRLLGREPHMRFRRPLDLLEALGRLRGG